MKMGLSGSVDVDWYVFLTAWLNLQRQCLLQGQDVPISQEMNSHEFIPQQHLMVFKISHWCLTWLWSKTQRLALSLRALMINEESTGHVRRVGLGAYSGLADELSGGSRQRVRTRLTLWHGDPDILLMDEAFSIEYFDSLLKCKAELIRLNDDKRTVELFFISHDWMKRCYRWPNRDYAKWWSGSSGTPDEILNSQRMTMLKPSSVVWMSQVFLRLKTSRTKKPAAVFENPERWSCLAPLQVLMDSNDREYGIVVEQSLLEHCFYRFIPKFWADR